MAEGYKYLNMMTSDVIFEAYGKDLKELFLNAAMALSESICDVKRVKPETELPFEVEGDSAEDLLVNWLQHIIASVDIEQMFFSKYLITEISDTHMKGFMYGEPVTQEKGETVVKAVTYYEFKFEKTSEGYKARVSVDI